MPETPRWLVFHEKNDKALKVLKKTRPAQEVEEEFKIILDSYKEYKQQKLGMEPLIGDIPIEGHLFFQILTVLYYSSSQVLYHL